MTGWLVFFIFLLLALGAWGILLFNRLVRLRNLVRAGLADIDVQLQLRHDLVPQLVEAVRGYAGFERSVLKEIITLREQAQSARGDALADREQAEIALALGLHQLLARVEDYPDLKAAQNFRQLMTELVAVEDQLQHARRFYNGAVRQFNTRVEQWPDRLLAAPLGFHSARFFSAGVEARVAPDLAGELA